MHLPPRQDPSVLLRKLDEDFVRRNPLVREEVFGDGNEGNDDKRSNDMDNKQFNDMNDKQFSEMDNKNTSNHSTNRPHTTPNNSSPKRIRITNDSPLSSLSYASDEEMNTLPQMKKVGVETSSHVVCKRRTQPNPLHSQSPQIHFL